LILVYPKCFVSNKTNLLVENCCFGPLIQAFALMMIAVATEHVECPAYPEVEEESADHSR
jgi:hypothetical protein